MARWDECIAGEEPWSKWWLDQLGHTGLGTAYALPIEALSYLYYQAAIPMTLIWGSIFALTGGVIREAVALARTGKFHPLDRTFDALFHLPGAVVAFGIVWIIHISV